jgi:hypothetical protein
VSGVTGRPTAGARLVVEKTDEGATAVTYRGLVYLPDADVEAEATVALPGGATRVTLGAGGSAELEKAMAALVRAATKPQVAAGEALPRKIVRWRP